LAWFSWAGFSAYQQDHADERIESAQYEANASKDSPSACRAIMDEFSFVDWLTCLADNVTADGGEKQAEYDLKAQQDMAEWAFGMLIVTVWLAVITFMGVLFVWRTWVEAKKTTEQAKREADIAEKSFLTLERPYLAVKITETQMLHNNQGGARAISYTIMNVGRSPAVLTAIRHHLGLTEGQGEWVAFYEVIKPGGELNNQMQVVLSETDSARATKDDNFVFLAQLSFMDTSGTGGEALWKFIKDGNKPFVLLNISE